MGTFRGPHRYFNLVCKVLVQKGFQRIRNPTFFNVAVVWMFGAGSCVEERKRMQEKCEKAYMQVQDEGDMHENASGSQLLEEVASGMQENAS